MTCPKCGTAMELHTIRPSRGLRKGASVVRVDRADASYWRCPKRGCGHREVEAQMSRRDDLIEAAVGAVRLMGGDDPRGYFERIFLTRMIEDANDADRELWQGITWSDVEPLLAQ